MYQVKYTNAFKKSYKLMRKRGVNLTLLDDVIGQLRCGKPLDPKYKDHALTDNYAGFRECHIQSD